jgi:hypothetical protein
MLTTKSIEYIEKFLKRPIVQEWLSEDSLDKIYSVINYDITADFSTSDFTDYLYGIEVNVMEYVTEIHEYMFAEQETLSHIVIPSNIKGIAEFAFKDCSSLEEVTIHDGVKKIGYLSFENCISLTDISIPKSVNMIEKFAFSGCDYTILTIHCKEDSAAHKYAIDNKINFKLI